MKGMEPDCINQLILSKFLRIEGENNLSKAGKTGVFILAFALILSTFTFGAGAEAAGRFDDVPSSAWYSDAVGWSVDEGVAEGTGGSTFSPNAVCTRAEIVTFIWRMAGSPEPSGQLAGSFTDLEPDAYYYDAMLWANETGIISGTSATTLSPNENCTRAQAVTLLWRYSGSDDSYTTHFTDVPKSAYCYEAVAWAGNRYVADGTTLMEFSPDSTCTRAQIVTMLYRMQRRGTEALLSSDIEYVRIENNFEGGERSLTAEETAEFKAILSRAALNEKPEPGQGEGQTSDPMYLVHTGYAGGAADTFYSTEAGATVLYKFTDTHGPGGRGYIAVRNEEMQSFFDRLGI